MTNSDEDDPIYAAMNPQQRASLDRFREHTKHWNMDGPSPPTLQELVASILAVLRSIDEKLDKLTGG